MPPELHNCVALRELDLGNNRIAKLVLDLRTLGRLGSLHLYGALCGLVLVALDVTDCAAQLAAALAPLAAH